MPGSGKTTFIQTALKSTHYCYLSLTDLQTPEIFWDKLSLYLNEAFARQSPINAVAQVNLKSVESFQNCANILVNGGFNTSRTKFIIDEIQDQHSLLSISSFFVEVVETLEFYRFPLILVSNFNLLISSLIPKIDFEGFTAFKISPPSNKTFVESIFKNVAISEETFPKIMHATEEISKFYFNLELKRNLIMDEIRVFEEKPRSSLQERNDLIRKIKDSFLWNVNFYSFFCSYLGLTLSRFAFFGSENTDCCCFYGFSHSFH